MKLKMLCKVVDRHELHMGIFWMWGGGLKAHKKGWIGSNSKF